MNAPALPLPLRLAGLDWLGIAASLDERGFATTGAVLQAHEADALAAAYDDDADDRNTNGAARFRSRVVMARHSFGRGEYKYFDHPLPAAVQQLRTGFYLQLASLANGWAGRMGLAERYPPSLDAMLARCHAAGQRRPTPLLLKYGPGDYNCLHQDLYGEQFFPLQAAFLLSQPGADFSGGEFVITEQRPRMQSRAHVVALAKGEAVIFAVHQRPVQGSRGSYRVQLRHGVSTLKSGRRYTLGVIFHDAA